MRFDSFSGPAYQGQSPNSECEDTINLFLEPIETEQGKNAYVMYKRPGYRLFAAPLGVIIISACPTESPVIGVAYSYTFIANTPNTPIVWSASGLPDGLSINSSTIDRYARRRDDLGRRLNQEHLSISSRRRIRRAIPTRLPVPSLSPPFHSRSRLRAQRMSPY